MNERIEGAHSAEIEEALGMLFAAPEPDPDFVDGLERQLMAQDKALRRAQDKAAAPQPVAETSPFQRLRDMIWQPLLRHRWAVAGIATLLALAVAFLAVGPQRVWADLQRLLSYVPGVGFVNLEETRVLTAPVAVTRGSVTLRVEQVLAQPDGTTVVVSSEGLPPEDELRPQGARMEDEFEPRLRLSDGQTLEPDTFTLRWGAGALEFPPLPSEVYRITLELPRLPLVPAGAGPEDWEIPLTLRPATGELVEELFPQPYALSDASDTHQGVTLRVLEVAHDPQETAVKLQLQWRDPEWKFPRLGVKGLVNLRDDVGHVYERAISPSSGSSSSSVVIAVPEPTDATATPEPSVPTYEETYAFSPVSLSAQQLMLTVEGIAFDFPVDTGFTVDLGDDPQVGDTWPLDVHLLVGGFPIHITGARLIEEEVGSREEPIRRIILHFDVVPTPEQGERVLSSIGLDGEAAGFRGGSTSGGSPQTNAFHAGLVVEQGEPIPDGVIQVRVARAELFLDHSWEVTWSLPGAEGGSEAKPAPITLHPEESVHIGSGLTLRIDEVVLTDRLTVIKAALDDPPPGVTLDRISHVTPDRRHELTLEDNRGRRYGWAWQSNVYWRPPEPPESDLSTLTFEPVQPLAPRLTLHVPAVSVTQPGNAAFDVTVPEGLTMTPGTHDTPWLASASWDVDVPLEVAGYRLCFTEARLEDLNGTILLTLLSEPYDPRRNQQLYALQMASVTAPAGREVDLETAYSIAGPQEEGSEEHRARLSFDVIDPETLAVQPGRYHVELDGFRVLVQGPWELSWNLPGP